MLRAPAVLFRVDGYFFRKAMNSGWQLRWWAPYSRGMQSRRHSNTTMCPVPSGGFHGWHFS